MAIAVYAAVLIAADQLDTDPKSASINGAATAPPHRTKCVVYRAFYFDGGLTPAVIEPLLTERVL